ncbi:MAG TPA: MBL fold metallo-hydrolase [Rhizomicrobium sp.]|jgi:glyoxylase-like metal-dependent hydrolase (beta-lactamase superfamily II)|nr:MBL fold metallo-hydrolase [Rhizomicrobium sp.]
MRTSLMLAVLAALLPIAARAQPASHILSADNLSKVAPHSWVIRGFPNVGIVVGDKATLVVDTGMGPRNGRIVAGIARSLSPKGQKLYLTTTHYHAEHASGDTGFPPGTVVIRPRGQQAELEAEGQKLIDMFSARSAEDRDLLKDARITKAGVLFDDRYSIDLGGVQVQLYWFGAAHTKGDELILVKPDNVLYSGDVVQNHTGPNFYCADCTPRSWLTVLDHVAALKPGIVVPDHSAPGGPELVAQERDFMADLDSRARALKAQGVPVDQAGKLVSQEFAQKYPDWSGMTHLDPAIAKAYAETP